MPSDINQVLILILFIIPGFVFTRVFGFAVPLRGRETLPLILDSLTISCLSYALLSPVVWILLRDGFAVRHPVWAGIGWFVLLFGFPALLACLAIVTLESRGMRWLRRVLNLAHPVPKAWDWFFRAGRNCWVIATMKDGRVVAGLFSENSYASAYPEDPDLYLEALCTLSPAGKITGMVRNSEGAILRGSEIALLEFYEGPRGV